jgi:hypothetical protein
MTSAASSVAGSSEASVIGSRRSGRIARARASRGHRSFHLEAPRRIIKLGACLVPSRPGALRDSEDSANRRPRPSPPAKEVVPTLLY